MSEKTKPAALRASVRLSRVRDKLKAHGAQAFLVRDTSNIAWATAFDNVFDTERAHALLIGPRKATLHTDSRYANAARKAAGASSGSVAVDDARKSHAAWTAAALESIGNSEIANASSANLALMIEDDITLAEYRALNLAFARHAAGKRVELDETSDIIRQLRAVKDDDEIERMQKAQAITDAAFEHIIGFMCPGMTEREVQVELDMWMLTHGASGLAFETIVATGANAANPHAIAGDTPLEAGQAVVMDFGARACGYCSDMTRTVFIGTPAPELKHAYNVLRRANEQVEAALKPGMTGAQAQQIADGVLEAGGFGGKMGHSLGHGVGLDIHELPNLSSKNDKELVCGNVVTVEPGIYIAGEFGMRLEDFGVITNDGFHVFTKSTHDMIVI